mmetsp:Transcript_58129/g.149651  ORF Transcript_58129/g.149651 Transcript_58129/m.149651 type:complete len:294 (-) Transcript_58129:344-1225(-)
MSGGQNTRTGNTRYRAMRQAPAILDECDEQVDNAWPGRPSSTAANERSVFLKPSGLQGVVPGRHPLLGVECQEALAQLFAEGLVRPWVTLPIHLVLLQCMIHVLHAPLLEDAVRVWHGSCHQQVEAGAHAIEVALLGALRQKRLRGIEAESAPPAAASLLDLRVAPIWARMVEVNELGADLLPRRAAGLVTDFHHKVVGLDVAVEHALAVHVSDCLEDLARQPLDLRGRDDARGELRQQALEEGAPVRLFHDDKVEVVILKDVDDGDHALVRGQVERTLLHLPKGLLQALLAK